jgi:hypothetical protein
VHARSWSSLNDELIGALVMTLTPIAAALAGSEIVDTLLSLLLVLAASAWQQAMGGGRLRYVLTGSSGHGRAAADTDVAANIAWATGHCKFVDPSAHGVQKAVKDEAPEGEEGGQQVSLYDCRGAA